MGQTGSHVAKKVRDLGSWWSGETPPEGISKEIVVSPFVYTRRGSMFFDEEGDLAHEFYEEVNLTRRGNKTVMKRKKHNLTPQGEVNLSHPRLHVDFPLVLCEVPPS